MYNHLNLNHNNNFHIVFTENHSWKSVSYSTIKNILHLKLNNSKNFHIIKNQVENL